MSGALEALALDHVGKALEAINDMTEAKTGAAFNAAQAKARRHIRAVRAARVLGDFATGTTPNIKSEG